MTQRLAKRLTIEFIILATLVGGVVGYYIPEVFARRSDAYDFVSPLVDIRQELVNSYFEMPDDQAMLEGAIQGMIETLNDPYTVYFTAEQLASFETHTRGTFSGIGAEIDKEGDYIRIVSPLEDSPAFKAGLVPGDLILAVNGDSLEGVSTEEAVKRITGEEGTDVTLTIRRADGAEEDVAITRARIKIETVVGLDRDETGHWRYMLDAAQGIGYIRMRQFSEPTYQALQAAVGEVKQAGAKGLVLDLRDNPGGLLDTAIKVADLFLDDGVIVSTRDRTGVNRTWSAEEGGLLTQMPMVVLINEASASASEILAGALKYNDRAVVLGTRTVGKGSVQQIVPLPGGNGGLKLTTSLYYMPNGQNIHRKEGEKVWGVDPSDGFYVGMTLDQRNKMLQIRRENTVARPKTNGDPAAVTPEWIEKELADRQLAAAVETMRAKLATGSYEKVGPGNVTALVHIARRDRLETQRQRMMERLDDINAELDRVDELIASMTAQPEPEVDHEKVPDTMDPEDMPAERRPPDDAEGNLPEPDDVERDAEVEPVLP